MEAFKDKIQNTDFRTLTIFCGPLVAVVIFAILLLTKTRDKMAASHEIKHRSKTSIESGRKEFVKSCSANDHLSLRSLAKEQPPKPETILTQGRPTKRKHQIKPTNNTKVQPINTKENRKGYMKRYELKQKSSNTTASLRKQCTKGEALKAALNTSEISVTLEQGPTNTLEIQGLEKSSTTFDSSASSVSSSASTSPSHSLNSSPTASPAASKRNTEYVKKKSLQTPLRQFIKLNMTEKEMVEQMKRYVLDPSLLIIYGFPVESAYHEGCVEIYKCLPKHLAEEAVTKDNQRHHRHFYGRRKSNIVNSFDGLYSSSCYQKWHAGGSLTDSGQGSSESSSGSTDSDSSEVGEEEPILPIMAFYTPDGVQQIFLEYCNSTEKQCVRCSKMFQVNEHGEYLSLDSCTYHWGKLGNAYNGKCYINIYSCCQGEEFSEGCSQHPLHVWNGVAVGINGPYRGFLHTQPKKSNPQRSPKIYAIDCEMSYTGLGLELTKVTVVRFDGSLAYEHFVKTQAEIVDYNTRFSGVSEKDFLPSSNSLAKTFTEVQSDLLKLFDDDTILIGHGLDNDLKVLRLVHKRIVDTSVVFSHSTGYPYRRSLKNLTKSFLKRDIQSGSMGHSSLEDSRACLELMMWKIRKDLRHWNYQ